MAEEGKKQTSKKKKRGVSARSTQAQKKTGRDRTRTSSSKKSTNFTRSATPKIEVKIDEPKELQLENQETVKNESAGFDQFETARIITPRAYESKILVRDVTREQPLPESAVQTVEARTPAPTPIRTRKTKTKRSNKVTAKQLKEQEIKKALNSASRLDFSTKTNKESRFTFANFGLARTVLAIACLSTAVFAIVYFVNLTSTDMSLGVAAMQSGIEAVYPSYIPRGFTLSDVTSSSGQIVMRFKSDTGDFSVTEESSSWDSNALLNNYIRVQYGNDYTVVREQGLTIYMGSDWEAWVNGKILFKLYVNSGELTKKQMKTIATELK